MDEGSYVKSVLPRLKDKKKKSAVRAITDATGDASLLKTEVLGEKVKSYRIALFTADTDCRE